MTDKSNSWQQNTSFKTHSHADWLHSVDKLLAGADFNNTLVSKTLDDISIQPIYQQLPNAPFLGRNAEPWSIQQCYNQGQPEEVNKQILSDLADGLTSVELTLNTSADESTTIQPAIACHNADALEQLLSGVHAEMIQLALTPGSENQLTGALLLAYYYRQKIAPENVRCALNIDPLKTQAETGQCAKSALITLTQYASYCANQFPNATSLCVDGGVYHNAGCSEAQEIAYTLSTTVEYLRALSSLDVDTACQQIRYRVALDSDFFLNIAKLRAMRELLRQVQQNCGAKQTTTLIDAVSGHRSLTTLDSSVNLLRTSTQTAAAMCAGANGFICTAHDYLTDNSDKAQRLARNTQHILLEESGLLNVDDPTRGSGYVEALTNELCQSAWDLFQGIESAGGMQQTLTSGLIAEQIGQSCHKRQAALSNGESTMIGVTDFSNLLETPVQARESKSTTTDSADKNTTISSVSVPALINALSEGQSTLSHNSHDNAPIASEPLKKFRDAERFEALRLRVEKHRQSNSTALNVTLLTIGSRKDYAARVSFCKNFFAVAGIKVSVAELTDVLAQSSQPDTLAVVCSSDKLYIEEAAALAGLNRPDKLWIAGNNPKAISALKGSISEQIHLRCDKLTVLEKALTIIGVAA